MLKSKFIIWLNVSILICSFSSVASVDIVNLENGLVAWRHVIEGTSSATRDSGLIVYLLIWPNETNGPWYNHPTATFTDGDWRINAEFGMDPDNSLIDVGHTYQIVVMMANRSLMDVKTFPASVIRDIPQINKSREITVTRTDQKHS